MKTTNYFNTLIEIAEDCPTISGVVPPLRGEKKSVANYQFEMLFEHPYQFTSDEVIFDIHAERNKIPMAERDAAREQFFSKGQACLRTSPLAKRYGWGIHSNAKGKVALFSADSDEYANLQKTSVERVKAMRSKRK
ncbi:MAG: DUF6157 family protein [Calditrichia bacterium]